MTLSAAWPRRRSACAIVQGWFAEPTGPCRTRSGRVTRPSVVEEPPAGLAAESPLLEHLAQPRRRRHPLLAERRRERLRGVDVDVDADQVDQRARPDRPVGTERHRAVDVLGRDAGLVDDSYAIV